MIESHIFMCEISVHLYIKDPANFMKKVVLVKLTEIKICCSLGGAH